MKEKGGKLVYLALHLLLMMFSLSTVCSKLAGRYPFFSAGFLLFYGLVILLLGLYAIFWQQIIKRMPLTSAFANKAVTVIWGLIWGVLLFDESITIGKLAGAALSILGILLFANAEAPQKADEEDA